MRNEYKPIIKDRFKEEYFKNRIGNDILRNRQFILDLEFINRFVLSGDICDVGCSTGEFIRSIKFPGNIYGMEISDYARKIASDLISFEKDIFTELSFFDLVIFRGTIQHVDEPFHMIKKTYEALKPGGYVVFLAVPNTNSPFFHATKTLPFLDEKLNFYIPDNLTFSNVLKNFGFSDIIIEYPYLETPYANPIKDHLKFIVNFLSRKMIFKHPFWRSSMSISARKPNDNW
jgi:SAM-dependent methyltransferase